ncbi:hypothetical protein ACU61A_40815 [Pseudonocardia sichuanensis]
MIAGMPAGLSPTSAESADMDDPETRMSPAQLLSPDQLLTC